MAKSLIETHNNKITKTIVRVCFLCFLLTIAYFQSSSAQFDQKSQLVSINRNRQAGNQAASDVSISYDGRYVVFISEADNLVSNDINESADAFLHDRLTSTTKLVSLSSTGEHGNNSTLEAQISGNGRYIVFTSSSSNLASTFNQGNSALFIHDQLTNITEQITAQAIGSVSFSGISANGRHIAYTDQYKLFLHDTLTRYTLSIPNSGAHSPDIKRPIYLSSDGRILLYSDEYGNLQVYDRVLQISKILNLRIVNDKYVLAAMSQTIMYVHENSINSFEISSNLPGKSNSFFLNDLIDLQNNYSLSYAVSNDGNYIIINQFEGGTSALVGYDLISDQSQVFSNNITPESITLSGNGNTFGYTQSVRGLSQIYVQDLSEKVPSYILSGRISDASGLPLAFVTIQDEDGNKVQTDRHGYFWFIGSSSKYVTLTPSKEGYKFIPNNFSIKILSDITNISFIANRDEIVNQARLDIGMPYSFERGCETPWKGCGEQFHGFSSGYCTDLVLDAYLWGADFNIQTALERDYLAHPDHFYRWRNARNTQDMWRYFSYNGMIFPHEIGYLPGDIVFFDWNGDGEIDHVSIVSEITNRNQPRKILDATGVIPSNPDGLADELAWEIFHQKTVLGHARWTGIYSASNTTQPLGEFLQIAASAADIKLAVYDSHGNRLDQSVREIPNSTYFNLGWEQSVNIDSSRNNSEFYKVQISNKKNISINYNFVAQIIKNDLVIDRIEKSQHILPSSNNIMYLHLIKNNDGELGLNIVSGSN
ncbi:MAG: DUF1287 domain-containing protein [Anaerolineae bacterium]|nr:DUF1287 domain-containing protein [Anaerolineae bacterium]